MLNPENQATQLTITNATIGYDGTAIVQDLSLTLKEGEIGCLLGPSGCGKSTLLRAIAGLEPLMVGEIHLQNQLVSSIRHTCDPEHRGVGMVFQDLALFPHFTVAENIRFGLRGWKEDEKRRRVDDLLNLVGLNDMQDRYPHSLSGGQQQRIALVRAMAPKPKLLLLDEPFSGLDTSLREALVLEVRELLLKEEMSALLVTHDQMEAFAIADKIAIMENGILVQCDTPNAIYHHPANSFVAEFIGVGDFLSGVVIDEYKLQSDLGVLASPTEHKLTANQKVKVLVRPDNLIYDDASDIKAKVIKKQFRGSHVLYRLRLPSQEELYYADSPQNDHALGSDIGVRLDLDNLIVFE